MTTWKKTWVLVVEDGATSRLMLAKQLRKMRFDVICARDGQHALEIVDLCSPDCVLLDLVMPRMHGHEFLANLREKEPDCPVIIMSAIGNQPKLVEAISQMNIQGWLPKPIDPGEMAEKILQVTSS